MGNRTQLQMMLVVATVVISASIAIPFLSSNAFAINNDPKFKITVHHVFTRDLKVDITLHGIHKSAIVHHGHSHTHGVTKHATINFGKVTGVHIGSTYNLCFSPIHVHPPLLCEDNRQITSLPVQKVTLDTNDFED